jgi:nitrilase
MYNEPFRIAAIQASPVFLDREASVDKACSLIADAAKEGAKLVVFPECFIPGYPLWVWFIPPGDTHSLRELYSELIDNAVGVPSSATDRIRDAAKKAGITVTIAVNETNTETSGTALFNTTLIICPEGNIIGKHRKLIPTAGERLVHGQGDGSTLAVHDTPVGRLGSLICWENYMPLARYAMYAWGMQILVAPTWDHGEPWTSTLRHGAKEGRVYVVGACSAVRKDDIPDRLPFKEEFLSGAGEWLNPGGSMIVDPDGKFVVEPVEREERILHGEVDPAKLKGPRFQLDVVGHYARPDLFELRIIRSERKLVKEIRGEEADETIQSS